MPAVPALGQQRDAIECLDGLLALDATAPVVLLSFAEPALDGSGDQAAARLCVEVPDIEDVARRLGLARWVCGLA